MTLESRSRQHSKERRMIDGGRCQPSLIRGTARILQKSFEGKHRSDEELGDSVSQTDLNLIKN